MEIDMVILCGGESTRMGKDKSRLPFGGSSLAKYVYRSFRGYFRNTYICVKNEAKRMEDLPCIVEDEVFLQEITKKLEVNKSTLFKPREGDKRSSKNLLFSPLFGIYSALQSLDSKFVAFVSVDTPFVKPKHYEKLLSALESRKDSKIGFIQGDKNHFLLSIWCKDVAPLLRESILRGERKLGAFVDGVRYVKISIDDWLLEVNINNEAQYKNALKMLVECTQNNVR